jgi:hypothetical protein
MTDDTYPPDPGDPRLGEALEEWQPSAAQRARTIELVHAYVAREPAFAALFNAYCRDVLNERALPQALLACLEHFAVTMLGAQGEQLTVARLASDLAAARDDVIRFGGLP